MSGKKATVPVCTGLLILFSLTGCASLSDHHYEQSQWRRARTAYRQAETGSSRYPSDYKQGWIDGFYEVSTGGPSCPPAFAPSEYWRPKQIIEDCDNRRHEYYSGWQDGAACASQYPETHYLRLFETCDCTVPRCDCQVDGCGACASTTGCQSSQGMALYPGAIEASGEIMILPSPQEPLPPEIAEVTLPAPSADEELPAMDQPAVMEEAQAPNEPAQAGDAAEETLPLPPAPVGVDDEPQPEASPSDRKETPTVLSDFEGDAGDGLIE
ncbi:MAG: hypothetical protein AAFU85_20435 [Planctomycetota bacterium]